MGVRIGLVARHSVLLQSAALREASPRSAKLESTDLPTEESMSKDCRVAVCRGFTIVLAAGFCISASFAWAQQPRGPIQGPPVQRAAAPAAPFTLSPAEQAELDRVLANWEQVSQRINTFKCKFQRWQYNLQFGNPQEPWTYGTGVLKYKRPDQGVYQVEEVRARIPAPAGQPAKWGEPEVGEHWVCDGESLYELDHKQKLLKERPLLPEMQGTAIANGPLPFQIFGASQEKLKARYWLRVLPSGPQQQGKIMLQAFPRWQQDASNYRDVTLMLDAQTMHPEAVQVVDLNKNRDSYRFTDIKINDPLSFVKGDFGAPRTPFGWKRVKEPIPSARPANPTAGRPRSPAR